DGGADWCHHTQEERQGGADSYADRQRGRQDPYIPIRRHQRNRPEDRQPARIRQALTERQLIQLRHLLPAVAGGPICSGVCTATTPTVFDVHPAEGVLRRLLPQQAAQFELRAMARGKDADRFRISAANEHIRVEGTTTSALLFGVNWYLKYVAQAQISPN